MTLAILLMLVGLPVLAWLAWRWATRLTGEFFGLKEG